MTIQNYVKAESLEQAYELNQKRQNRIIGGMLWMRMSGNSINTAIDLSGLGLDSITETEDAFEIGAYVTLSKLEQHEGLNQYSRGAVAACVHDIVGTQFRNMATVGGSIWGRFGFSDVLTMMLAMDASVRLYKAGEIPLAQFAAMDYDNDVLTYIIIRKSPASFAYQTVRIARTDFPVLTCAAAKVKGSVQVAVGARPGRAELLVDTDGMLTNGIDENSARMFADKAAAYFKTAGNTRGSASYRTQLIRVLVRRTLLEMEGK